MYLNGRNSSSLHIGAQLHAELYGQFWRLVGRLLQGTIRAKEIQPIACSLPWSCFYSFDSLGHLLPLCVHLSVCVQFGNVVVLDKFTNKLDDGKKKKLDEMLAEAKAAAGGGVATTGPAANMVSAEDIHPCTYYYHHQILAGVFNQSLTTLLADSGHYWVL